MPSMMPPAIYVYEDRFMAEKKVQLSTIVSLVLFLFSALYFYQSMQYAYWVAYGPGAGFVPSWVSGLCTVLCGICTFNSLRENGLELRDAFPKGIARMNLFTFWAGLLFFIIVVPVLGFLVTSVVLLSVLYSLGEKNRIKAVCYGIVTTAIAYGIFKILLKVPVPVNHFGW